MKIINIEIDLFQINIEFIIGNFKETKKWILNEYNIDVDISCADGLYVNFIYKNSYKNFILLKKWINNPEMISVLVHEISHASVKIIKDLGIITKDEHNELYAYMNDFILRKFLEKIKN